jgi:hypothetical protein
MGSMRGEREMNREVERVVCEIDMEGERGYIDK